MGNRPNQSSAVRARQNILITPLEQQENITPSFDAVALSELINQLQDFIQYTSLPELQNSNLMYWLSYALHCAVETNSSKAIKLITNLTLDIGKKDEYLLAQMFNTTIPAGEYKGQTITYMWMNELYTAIFNPQAYTALVSINYTFSQLLNTANPYFVESLIQATAAETHTGKNALIVLCQSLVEASKHALNQPTTKLLAELLNECLLKSPSTIGAELTKEVEEGVLRGKSGIYLLVCTLQAAARDNDSAVNLLCNILLILQKEHPSLFIEALSKTLDLGPKKGLNSFHIILESLVSAAYIRHNEPAVLTLISFIFDLLHSAKEEFISLLKAPITRAEYQNENAVMFLVKALIALQNHDMSTTALTNLIVDLLKTADQELLKAFCSVPSGNSPLDKILNSCEKKTSTDENLQNYQQIIKAFVSNPDFNDLMANPPQSINTLLITKLTNEKKNLRLEKPQDLDEPPENELEAEKQFSF